MAASPLAPPHIDWGIVSGVGLFALGVFASVISQKAWRVFFGVIAWLALSATAVYASSETPLTLWLRVGLAMLASFILANVTWRPLRSFLAGESIRSRTEAALLRGDVTHFSYLDAYDLSNADVADLGRELPNPVIPGGWYTVWLELETTTEAPSRARNWRFSVKRKNGATVRCTAVSKSWPPPPSWPRLPYVTLDEAASSYIKHAQVCNVFFHVIAHDAGHVSGDLDMASFEAQFTDSNGIAIVCRVREDANISAAERILAKLPEAVDLKQRVLDFASAIREALTAYHGSLKADGWASEEMRKHLYAVLHPLNDRLSKRLNRRVLNGNSDGLTVRGWATMADDLEDATAELAEFDDVPRFILRITRLTVGTNDGLHIPPATMIAARVAVTNDGVQSRAADWSMSLTLDGNEMHGEVISLDENDVVREFFDIAWNAGLATVRKSFGHRAGGTIANRAQRELQRGQTVEGVLLARFSNLQGATMKSLRSLRVGCADYRGRRYEAQLDDLEPYLGIVAPESSGLARFLKNDQ
jgi:hypothetical protein